jgi:uncharacterized protein YbjT (DUF2867 family)
MKKAVIVLGGTGLVGKALIDQLAEAEHIERVVALSRRAGTHSSEKVTYHVVDFDKLDQHADLFRGDMLFSCLGTTRKQAGSVEAQRIVDFDYQYQAAQLAVKQGVEHYLLVSSSAANASSNNAYLKMKGELEEGVEQLSFPRTSILQPSLLIGERDHLRIGEVVGSWILSALCKLPPLQRYRPIQGREVAARMVQLSRSAGSGVERLVLEQVFPVNPLG